LTKRCCSTFVGRNHADPVPAIGSPVTGLMVGEAVEYVELTVNGQLLLNTL
jgi:hypothetical protein